MCGIAGIVRQPGEAPSPRVLASMSAAMAHRGPDDEAIVSWGRAGFAFRRLSIIDVGGGRQPLDDESGRVHVIANGEIYNHVELRAELEALGHRFRSGSDAEVIVHGYEEFGDEVVSRLRGMFAFALWDESRERLLLARDRLGQKPLVYREAGGAIAFASELGALLADPEAPREPDPKAIDAYLTYQYVPAPQTAFEGVRKLPPAHRLVFEAGRGRVERYWSLSAQPTLRISAADATLELERRLDEAVRIRLMSDVPLGAFLSGGLDSSSVVALMAQHGPVKTFSVGFEETDFDELPYAREVASRFATEHHEVVVRPRAAEVVVDLARHFGEPYADSSALPTWYLARMTATEVKVALNGDGGDELLAGYDRYRILNAYCLLGRLPSWCGRAARGVATRLETHLPARARRLLASVSARPELSYARTISYFTPEERWPLYNEGMRAAVAGSDAYQAVLRRFAESDAPDLLGQTLYADLMTYLPDDLLAKVDIASMAHGLEARSPFLDHELVEFAARLPSSLKLGMSGGKRLLRKVMAARLPDRILRRRKRGFGVPIGRWLRGELRSLLSDLLLAPDAAIREFLQPAEVRRICEQHWSGRRDRSMQLWALMMLELWLREVVRVSPATRRS